MAANACKFVMPKTAAERKAAADRTVKAATAIIDAKVIKITKANGVQVTILESVRTIKGPKGEKRFTVHFRTSCDRSFDSSFRGRVLLFGGPKDYRATSYPSSEEDISAAIGRMPEQRKK
jgi:hypothetical protein